MIFVAPIIALSQVEETMLWVMQATGWPVPRSHLVLICGGSREDAQRAVDFFVRIDIVKVDPHVSLTARGEALAVEVAKAYDRP